ncbi:hypothetical protein OK016_02080 [Vibrio chagasii]|nr:hypothetical protein [Vibrio chagasii]
MNSTFDDEKAKFLRCWWSIRKRQPNAEQVTRTTVEGFYYGMGTTYLTAAYRLDGNALHYRVTHGNAGR